MLNWLKNNKKTVIIIAALVLALSAVIIVIAVSQSNKTECEKNGHKWSEATCTSPKTCTVCQSTTGDKADHVFTNYTSNNDATCTYDGTKTAKCDNCNATDTVNDSGSKKAHAFGEWEISKATTCTADGTEQRNCAICSAYETRPLATSGHSYNTDAWGYQGADGHAHKCTSCGEKDSVTAHTPGEAATESSAQTCTVCSYVIAPPLEHTHAFTVEEVSEATLKTPADCENAAVYYKSCSCGAVSTSDADTFEDGEANGHILGPEIVTEEPDCITEGACKHECIHCDYYEEGTVDALGHAWRDATENEPKTCTRCGETDGSSIGSTLPGDMDPNGWTDN